MLAKLTRLRANDATHAVQRISLSATGPTAILVHATGFCGATWRPVVADIVGSVVGGELVIPDMRGHGNSSPLPAALDWWDLGRDILAVLGGREDVIGVGHSAGATAVAMAEILSPGTFRSLVLVEPIIIPPPYGRTPDHPLAVGARRRRFRFASTDEALNNYRTKLPFQGWHQSALLGYLDGGFRREGDGSLTLRCSPDDEAEFFSTGSTARVWDRLEALDLPIELIVGAESDVLTSRRVEKLMSRMSRVTLNRIPNTNHFVAMQRPDVVSNAVVEAMGGGLVQPITD